MNGLGLNRFAAGYLVGVTTDGAGTLPSITTPWVINKFASDWFSICSRTPGSAYPFIGGTADAHSKDLFLRRNITWVGTVTHTAIGVQGNGTTGYGLLGLSRDIFPDVNRYSYGCYVNSLVTNANMYDMGNAGIGQVYINARSSTMPTYCLGDQSKSVSGSANSGVGLVWQRRDSAAAAYTFYNNATNAGGITYATQGTTPASTYICSISPSAYFSTRRYAFAFVCPAILSTLDPYPLIQALQIHCSGRHV